MNTLFLGLPLFIGSLFGIGFLAKLFIAETAKNSDTTNFHISLLIWSGICFVAVFIVLFTYWFMADVTAYLDDIISLSENDDFNFSLKLKYSFICTLIFSLCFTTMIAYKIYKKNKGILYYGIFALILSILIGVLVNLIFKEIPLLLIITIDIAVFNTIIACFEKFDSYSRKNKILTNHINDINKSIKNSIDVVKRFLSDYEKSGFKKTKYNKCRKQANKYIRKKHFYKTFQAKFKEDVTVLKIISLFNSVDNPQLNTAYKMYKKNFEKENTFKLLEKASKNKNVETVVADTKQFLILLEAVVRTNCGEISCLSGSEKNKALYDKYEMFQPNQIRNKFIILSIVAMAFLVGAIILNCTNMF